MEVEILYTPEKIYIFKYAVQFMPLNYSNDAEYASYVISLG